jgi:hypothetical protein
MLGSKLSLSLTENNLRSNLWSHLLGKSAKLIQGSAMMMKSGFSVLINLLSANLEALLAMPLIFQYKPFI